MMLLLLAQAATYLIVGVRYDLENGSGTMEIVSRIQKEIHRRSIQGVAAEIFELGVRHWRRRCQIEKRHKPVVETNALVIECGQRLWYSIVFGKTSQCLFGTQIRKMHMFHYCLN